MFLVQGLGFWIFALLAGLFAIKELTSHLLLGYKLRTLRCGKAPCYPQKIPFFGFDLYAVVDKGRRNGALLSTLQNLFRVHGKTFQATIWGQTKIYTIDVANIQAIHTTEFDHFGVEAIRKSVNQGWIGDGIFVSDGPVWKQSRNLLKPAFSKSQFVDLLSFGTHVDRLLALVPNDGATVDVQPLFQRLFLDVSTGLLFGEPAQSLIPGSARLDVDKFNASFDRALLGMTKRTSLGRALPLFNRDPEWQKAYTYVHTLIDGYIDRALEQKHRHPDPQDYSRAESPKTGQKERPFSILYSLMDHTEDRHVLRDQLLNVFIGARDTAAIGVSDLFFHLARHPRVWHRLRAEALKVGQPVTFDVLKSMEYLQCVLRESLRLLAPADVSLRTCLSDCVLPHGGGTTGTEPIYVCRGTRVEMRFGIMHRDREYWGPGAEQFRPERWLEAPLPKWRYIPFLGGARMCPAQQMVLTQYAFILVRFLQDFESIENRDPEIRFIEEIKFAKKSRNGVKVAFTAAKHA